MATYAENIASLDTLNSELQGIESQADSDIAAKKAEIAALNETILSQEESCGHTSWSKVTDEWVLECDACGKKVELVDPSVLWPWAT